LTRHKTDLHYRFDTPSLREVYRTGPYMHDGRAETLREVLTVFNPDDLHGRTSQLTEEELDDLVAYLRSL
jgi:cytochrome c peroxidase